MLDRSPIEQALIDGVLYWDEIQNKRWLRLIHRATMDVWGHYQFKYGWTPRWVACTKSSGSWSFREFKTAEEAREWIETTAASRLLLEAK